MKSTLRNPVLLATKIIRPFVIVLLLVSCTAKQDTPESLPASQVSVSEQITNHSAIADAIRTGMCHKAQAVTVSFSLPVQSAKEAEEMVKGWMEEALQNTESPVEGDYLRYQYGGYKSTVNCEAQGGTFDYTVRIEPDYYSTPSQEEQVTQAVSAVLAELALPDDATDEEVCAAVYQYLCTRVTYDKVHQKNPYNRIDATAYAALVNHSASCQGYCTALYRLLKECGIACKIVTGTAGAETLHAWCLAEVDGTWYLLDPTFDAGQETYRYFLTDPEKDTDHIEKNRG